MNARRSPDKATVPAAGIEPGVRDVFWLIRYCIRGIIELLRARIAFSNQTVRELLVPKAANEPGEADLHIQQHHIARIAYVLPRLGARLPWRADCLVQALAGRHWLSATGAHSEIQIGVERPENGEFGAHAWLVCEGQIVTGGDISRYAPLLADQSKSL